ncbi:MAG: GAF domain-containing protein [Boseongicola sp. SB0677_bin_26]|nr:GAF domain-containing protein [Boseongicola sp. SB0665_bin_10]MYG26491.1 GAF domain-containing protein [Boseongicola sp. SB0677_bin_26]
MAKPGDLKRENDALRRRIATLNATILRTNASLDLDTVLEEVVESARALTGARWGVIATVDEAGAPLDCAFSGFTSEEQRELYNWPERARLFAHFHELPGPLRVDDLAGYVRALGIDPALAFSRSFQGTPMRHRGADVGSFFLANKVDGEAFTDEDEEVMTLFASQAASVIPNARAHRDERHARADLEALVESRSVHGPGRKMPHPKPFQGAARSLPGRGVAPGASSAAHEAAAWGLQISTAAAPRRATQQRDRLRHAPQVPNPFQPDGQDSRARISANRSRASGKRRFPSAGASRDFRKWQVVIRPSRISAAVPSPWPRRDGDSGSRFGFHAPAPASETARPDFGET